MALDDSFDDLKARLRQGDEQAAALLFQRFAERLIGLARSRMDRMIRQKLDAEDVVQSVFKSFFRRHSDGDIDLENWDKLWSLLVVITLRKCVGKARHFRGQGRDVRKEAAAELFGDDSGVVWEAAGREPTPDEAALLTDTVAQALRALNERERQVFELRLQGHSVPEISAQIVRSEYAVEGILKKIRKELKKLRDADDDEK